MAEAVRAVSRLVAAGDDQPDPARVHATLVDELRSLLGVRDALLLALEDGGQRAVVVAGGGSGAVGNAALAALADVLNRPHPAGVEAALAQELAAELGLDGPSTGSALLLGVPAVAPTHVVILADPDPSAFGPEARAAAEALVAAGAATLARREQAHEQGRHDPHQALTRAARNLHESLDLEQVLHRIAQEANRILDGDYTTVYRGTSEGVAIEAADGMPPEMIGFRLHPGQGLPGRVLESAESLLTNDYPFVISGLPIDPFFSEVRSCLAVPMTWGGELRGVLTVGYKRPFHVTEDHLALLETFAELAAVACTNASAHAGLALAARTDGLTGCINHAAMHESLQREIERCERAVAPTLSMIMIDLDDFKSVNELHGHLIGDEVLRRTGQALRQATRPYDIPARYGGDEFALLAVEAGEAEAQEIARRAGERIAIAIADLCEGTAGRATSGVAEWEAGVSPTDLVARADRALLYGKHEGGRGQAIAFTSVPQWFRPGRFGRRPEPGEVGRPMVPQPSDDGRSEGLRPSEQRLRDRTLQLARAGALATRLTPMVDVDAILATASEELGRALDDSACSILRVEAGALRHVAGADPQDRGPAEQCLAQERPVLAAAAAARAQLAVPLRVSDELWGVLAVWARKPGALDDDDLLLAQAVADHTGAALQAALRYAELERAHAEALAALRAAQGSSG